LLYAREVPPEGGDTLFTNMYAAYEALPEEKKKRIDGLRVLHSRVKAYPLSYPERAPMTEEEKARVPDVTHLLVRTHPEAGRKALFVGGNVAWEIVGLPLAEGQALIRELREFAIQERFVYRHHWKLGDAILWDNRSTMHCATAFDEERYRRVMHRTTVEGDEPI
jgi:alpha-ketoglutarate-dependent taurine dioxygenase